MRISEQNLTLGVEYQQQQAQLRQQTRLNGTGPAREIRLQQQHSDYQEASIESMEEGRQSNQTTLSSEAEVTAQARESQLLNRRELARQAREQTREAANSPQPSSDEATDPNALPPGLEMMRQTSEWLDSLGQDAIAQGTVSSAEEPPDTELSLDSQLRILKTLLEKMLDITITLPSFHNGGDSTQSTDTASSAAPPPTNGQSPDERQAVQVSELSLEQEQLVFAATGSVTTSDGREIALDLGFALSYQKLSLTERLTQASALKDPLILNLQGLVPGFTDARFAFDLDTDGTKENLPQLNSNSAFLALDRNGNGQIDNGSELFGAQSGNGFADLVLLDEDGNGVLDEADSSFAALRLYRPDTALLTLGDQQIGAIFLNAAATPFLHLGGDQTATGESPAVLRQTGLYLTEDGKAGTVQQIDLRV